MCVTYIPISTAVCVCAENQDRLLHNGAIDLVVKALRVVQGVPMEIIDTCPHGR